MAGQLHAKPAKDHAPWKDGLLALDAESDYFLGLALTELRKSTWQARISLHSPDGTQYGLLTRGQVEALRDRCQAILAQLPAEPEEGA